MKKSIKKTIAVYMLTMMGGLLLAACSDKDNPAPQPTPTPGTGTGQKLWKAPETVEHRNFKDLGNYVIELPDFTDAYEIGTLETPEAAMEAMKPLMWRNEILLLDYSYRLTEGQHHPYNQIVFRDEKGNPSLDWRGEYVMTWPVLDDGRALCEAQMYTDAGRCTYDPKIKQYLDEAIATGRLIIDDGSIKFTVNGEQLTLTELNAKNSEYESATDKVKRAALQPYNDEHRRIMNKDDNLWIHNDENFEAAKAMAYAMNHIRYDAEGKCDPSPSCLSKYEKLLSYHGLKGWTKDEKPLRDAGNIWTTGLNIGVNCAQKEIKIRFWENDEIIYHFKW